MIQKSWHFLKYIPYQKQGIWFLEKETSNLDKILNNFVFIKKNMLNISFPNRVI